MKKLLLITTILIVTVFLYADNLSNIPSAFLDVGFGARAMGMGGAHTAVTNNAGSIIWNPAAGTQSKSANSVSFDNIDIQGLYSYSFFGFLHKTKSGNSFGTGFIYSGDDAMSETSIIFASALSENFLKDRFRFPVCDIGLNMRILLSSFGNNENGAYLDPETGLNHQVTGNASGFSFDLSIHKKLSDNNHYAIVLKNPISYISWDSKNEVGTAKGNYSEGLPTSIIFGYGKESELYSFALDLDKSIHSDTDDLIMFGAEYNVFKDIMTIRSGYSQEMMTGDNKRYSVGTGFNINPNTKYKLFLDLAYQIETNWEKHNSFRLSCDILM